MEKASDQVQNQSYVPANSANDSILRSFDPFARTSPAEEPTSTASSTKSVMATDLAESPAATVANLISPSFIGPSVLSPPVLNTTLSASFTPVLAASSRASTSHVPPVLLSPWLHHSILEQALGGFDHSPEWHPSSTSKIETTGSSYSEFSSCADSTFELNSSRVLSTSVAAGVDGIDDLTAMLGRVNVQDDSVSDHGSSVPSRVSGDSKASSVDDAARYSEHSSGSALDGICIKGHCTITPTVVNAAPQRPPDSAPQYTPGRTPNPNVVSYPQPASANRLSIRGFSEFMSNMAHSIFDHIGSASRLGESLAHTTKPEESTPLSPEICETRPPLGLQPGDLERVQPSCETSTLPVRSDQSVDDDVWESVHSTHDSRPTNGSASISVPSSETAASIFFGDDKENVPVSEINSANCPFSTQSELHYAQRSSAHDKSNETSRRVNHSRLSTHVDITADPLLSPSQVSQCGDLAHEWSYLQEEVYRLRNTADTLSSVLLLYEKSFLDVEVSEAMRLNLAMSEICRIANERDEAIDQASTMLRAYEDMARRLHRAKEKIETQRNKQQTDVDALESCIQKRKLLDEKTQQLQARYLGRLADALTQHDHAEDSIHRRLDKLHLDIRQYELKNSTLSNQIEQLQRNSEELTKISQQFFN